MCIKLAFRNSIYTNKTRGETGRDIQFTIKMKS